MKPGAWVNPLALVDAMCNRLSSRGAGAGGPSSGPRPSDCVHSLWEKASTFEPSLVRYVGVCLGAEGLPKFVRGGALFTFRRPLAVVVRAAYFTRAVLEVLYDTVPIEKFRNISIESQLSIFRRALSWPEHDFDKNAKYFCVRPMAQFLHQVLPSSPPDSYGSIAGKDWMLFTGPMRRLLGNRVASFNHVNLHLMEGLLQGVKRACFTVSPLLVQATLQKHSQTLRTDNPVDTPRWGDEHNPFSMDSYIVRVVHSLFKKPLESLHLFDPSTSASFERSRAEGGAYSEVTDWLADQGLINPSAESVLSAMVEVRPGQVEEERSRPIPSFEDVLDRMTSLFHLRPLKDIVPPNVQDFGEQVWTPEFWGDYVDPLGSAALPPDMGARPTVPEEWVRLDAGMAEPDYERQFWRGPTLLGNSVRVAAVLEPLKVRLVSAGQALPYWMSQSFQKYMWSALQTTPIFRLTGRPLLESDLFDLLDPLDPDTGMWVSGDYSSATDSVKLGWTVLAFEQVLKRSGVGFTYARLLRRVLYGQDLTYGKDNLELNGLQRSGQLMGSTLSFPILCILNLAAYWKAFEFTHGKTSFRHLQVMVNGDDILFRVPAPDSVLYRTWLRTTREIGFSLSPGKNYVHPRYLCVNSEGYLYNPAARSLRKVGFLNVGLMIGQAKISRREGAQLTPIQGKYDAVIEGAANRVRAHRRFLHYNREVIAVLTNRGLYSMFVDPLLGGLGFNLSPDVTTTVTFTKFQKGFASFCYQRLVDGVIGHQTDLCKAYVGVCAPRTSTNIDSHSDRTWGHFVLRPRLRPLFRGEESLKVMDVSQCPMNRLYLDEVEAPSMRLPKSRVLRQFRDLRDHGGLHGVSRRVLLNLSRDHWWVRVHR